MVLSKAVLSRLCLLITLAVLFGCGYNVPSTSSNGSGSPYVNTPDVTPPTVPIGLKAIPLSSTEISLIWGGSSDDRGVVSFHVYRDGAFLLAYTLNMPLPIDGGLIPNTRYCYTITALDAAGNESQQSDQSCAYTLWPWTTVDAHGDFSSLELDASGAQHLSYINGSGDLMYATNTSGAWSMTTIDLGAYEGTSLALDSAGRVHISYCENGFYSLKYATNASGAWVTTIIDDNWVGPYPSLALDSAGRVHISYYDYGNGFLKYATNATGAWVTYIVDNSVQVGWYTSLAVDSADKVHISYYDFGNGDLKYATNASGTWVVSTIDSVGDVGRWDSLPLTRRVMCTSAIVTGGTATLDMQPILPAIGQPAS